MEILQRRLDLRLPKGRSAFLWGPRKTGKTTYLKQRFPDSIVYDFLKTDLFKAQKNSAGIQYAQDQIFSVDGGQAGNTDINLFVFDIHLKTPVLRPS